MRKMFPALAAPALLALGLSWAPPAHAAGVTLEVSAANHAAVVKSCPVTVSDGANGIAVLNAAKASGCISGYTTRTFPGIGRYVACIDGICQATDGVAPETDGFATYWEMRENGSFTSYGIDGFTADAGDRLTLTYTNFATFLVP